MGPTLACGRLRREDVFERMVPGTVTGITDGASQAHVERLDSDDSFSTQVPAVHSFNTAKPGIIL